ncbi:LacI family DNA-binding transcriptional regulator [Cellulomonas endophytica]|uniref:LacI family DNA-binding transcriptional regulator n=1 Tax=Cellulomonas endophytica TaxID=2494735 RepID=UPI001010E659|nr:LacI family DNA-binding transcriptional regulator [Cellulomonas endophytica]
MSTPGARPTLLDVARTAGVSRATAARVLAGSGTVREDMASRVHAAAGTLGYLTNPVARALRRGRTGAVAVVVPHSATGGLAAPFVTDPVQGASTVLFERSLQPVLLLDDGRNTDCLVHHLLSGFVDAAVVIPLGESEALFRELGALRVPVVFAGHPSADVEGRHFVDADNLGGARAAARALLEAGRRRIGMLAGPAAYEPAVDRERGLREELAAWGVPAPTVVRGDFSLPSGVAACEGLLRRLPDVDGVFAASDLMAVGALRALAASGRRVPEDVSVVGFDDTVVAATSEPPLTTVRQPLREMGARAARMVLELLERGALDEPHVLLPTVLTRRGSV